MDKNVKIAKELVKLAKSLVAGDYDIADKEGRYENFTGAVKWMGTDGHVENATFDLSTGGHYVYWENGTWKDGTLKDVIWENGTFDNGSIYDAIWENGVWNNGEFYGSIWSKGTWNGGTWKDGIWHYGTWEGGVWENGDWHSGTWKGGTWNDGWWNLGFDKEDNQHDESPDKW